MKEKPWQDIFTDPQWSALLERYKHGAIGSKSKKLRHHIARVLRWSRTFSIPTEVAHLTQQIQHYHQVEKRSIGKLETRAGLLRTMANTCDRFRARNRIPLKAQQKKDLDTDDYKQFKTTLDYAVGKVARRARRKADYIDKLRQHIADADRGFTGRKNELLAYIAWKQYGPDDEDLVAMNANVRLEKIDPWHRTFEATFRTTKSGYRLALDSTATIYACAFNQWIDDDTETGEVPFFVWLEGHYACTNVTDQRLLNYANDMIYQEPRGMVEYHRFDEKTPDHVPFIAVQNGQLWAYRMSAETGDFDDVDLYDTAYTAADFPDDVREMAKGKFRMHAYVWSRDGFIFAGPHIGQKFHHSSFTSGRKVRCAGMITVENGKVKRVDNDSGHYKPGRRHLRNFITWLQSQNAFTADAVVEDKSVTPNRRGSVATFLHGDDRVEMERRFQLLSRGVKSLHDLVSERFEELKEEHGNMAPEQDLWIRSYKLICLELGEFDAKWKTRANAPAIPMDKAPKRGKR